MRRHLSTMLVAFGTAAVTAAGPALAATIADYATNADKVDGKHAVSASATVAERRNKIVATDADGRLPNNVIAKAPDAGKLDGVDSAGFLRSTGTAANAAQLQGHTANEFAGTTLRSEQVVQGVWMVTKSSAYTLGDAITYPAPLAAAMPAANVHFLAPTSDPIAACPGAGQAAAGHLCFYGSYFDGGAVTFSASVAGPLARIGAIISFDSMQTGAAHGTWTLHAP